MIFEDIRAIESDFLRRYSEVKETSDALELYEEIVEEYMMESWGTWIPYYPMRMIETNKSWHWLKLYTNLNFFDDNHRVVAVPKHESFGFNCSFNHPWEDKTIIVDFVHYIKEKTPKFSYSYKDGRRKLNRKNYEFK